MVFSLHFFGRNNAFNPPFLINQKGCPKGTHICSPSQFLLAPYTKLFDKTLIRIGYKSERQLIFFDETKMRLFTVHTDSYHLITSLT